MTTGRRAIPRPSVRNFRPPYVPPRSLGEPRPVSEPVRPSDRPATGQPGAFPGVLVVPGNPIPQPRPRVYRNGGVGENPKASQHKGRTIAAAISAGMRPLDGPVVVELWFYRSDRRRCDWDNLAKLTCDALKGIAWHDDDQITDALVRKRYDPDHPRTEIEVRPLGPAIRVDEMDHHEGPA